jgi:hypothetical protein
VWSSTSNRQCALNGLVLNQAQRLFHLVISRSSIDLPFFVTEMNCISYDVETVFRRLCERRIQKLPCVSDKAQETRIAM